MSDYKVRIGEKEISVRIENGETFINGKKLVADVAEYKKGHFHVLRDHRSFNAEVVEYRAAEKTAVIRVNNNTYMLRVGDRYDELLHAMGMDAIAQSAVSDVKAPMPGLVLKVMVEPGQAIEKGETLLILEAMKMENILKAPSGGIVKKVLVHKGDKVEKNQVMVNLGEG